MHYYLRRVGQSVFTMLSGLFLTYALYRIAPGDPLQSIVADIVERGPENIDSEQIARIAETMTGINPQGPIVVGFVDYGGARSAGEFDPLLLGRCRVAIAPGVPVGPVPLR
jgi:peptide/nickel transport system permease protein